MGVVVNLLICRPKLDLSAIKLFVLVNFLVTVNVEFLGILIVWLLRDRNMIWCLLG